MNDVDCEIYLFGSRIYKTKSRGDIDKLILKEESNPFNFVMEIKTKYYIELVETIDVIRFNPNQLTNKQKSFLNSITKVRFN